MHNVAHLLLYAVVALAIGYLVFRAIAGVRSYFKFQGKRLVTCPETDHPAAVEMDARHAAKEAVFGTPHLRLSHRSRWPERQDCGQLCLKQIESAPEECLVRSIVSKWYAGKTCVYCHKPIDEIDWLEQKPAVVNPGGKTVQWSEVSAEKLPEVFSTHLPVCWSCHIAETFRREHPELVVERPWRWRS